MCRIYIITFFVFFLTSCGVKRTELADTKEYAAWINREENGLIKLKKVNGMQLSMKYLPAEYLLFKELKDHPAYTPQQRDSLKEAFFHTHTFLMTIGPDEEKGNKADVMTSGVGSYKEYVEKVMNMNFAMEERIVLKVGESEYKPVLSTLENTYGLKNSRSIVLVFAPQKNKEELTQEQDMDLVYTDDLFDMGILHFGFLAKDVANAPQIEN